MERDTGRLNILLILGALFLAAFLVRFYNIGAVTVRAGDEGPHIPSASNYVERGYFGPDAWYHPPLKHFIHYLGLRVFGNNPYGWRMMNVVLGSATVVMTLLFLRENLPLKKAPYFSAGLLLLDPLHVFFSRSTVEEVPFAFFITAAAYFMFRGIRRRGEIWWLLCGVSWGCAFALKWYALGIAAMAVLLALAVEIKRRGWSGMSLPVTYGLVVPAVIYMSAYIPWFLNGHSIAEWFRMHQDALREMRNVNLERFGPTQMLFFSRIAGASRWFVQPVSAGFEMMRSGERAAYVFIMNNLPVWIWVLPSLCAVFVVSLKKRWTEGLFIVAAFSALYVPLLAVQRPIFLYSSLPLLPFAFSGLGYCLERYCRQWSVPLFIAFMLWSAFLYPLTTGIRIPLAVYGPIVERLTVINR
ncbi:MAG: hypothetical protein OHK006_06380 [Thermodesulfovibrionales bacterium]